MKFLADVNIEKFIVEAVKELRYDIKSVVDIDPLLSDTKIVELARKENRIILTNDKDFGEIVFNQKELTSGIILFREVNKQKKPILLKQAIKQITDESFFIVIRKEKVVQRQIIRKNNYKS